MFPDSFIEFIQKIILSVTMIGLVLALIALIVIIIYNAPVIAKVIAILVAGFPMLLLADLTFKAIKEIWRDE